MINYYFVTIFFAVFMMAVLKIMVCGNDLLKKDSKKKFDQISTFVIITSLAEWLGVILDGGPAFLRPVHMVVKMVELSLAPFIPLLCADIIGRVRYAKIWRGILFGQAFLELLSGFLGFIFRVDAANVYSHGPFYWIYIVAFSGGILLFIWEVFHAGRYQYGTRRVLLLLLPVFSVLGLAFQYAGVKLRVIWLCTAVDVLLMYLIYLEVSQNTDPLTHLLNRRYYEGRIARLREPATIFYFDVNNFKNINDTYGHAYGDVTLAVVGENIQSVYGKKGYCYRIGGDEFCAITQIEENEAETYIAWFHNNMERIRQKDARTPYVAVGYAHFNPETDSVADTIELADAMMYQYKRRKKNEIPSEDSSGKTMKNQEENHA